MLSRDTVAPVRDCITLADAVRLSGCAPRLCRINKHGFCATFPFHDPPSQTQFQNDEVLPYVIFSEVFDRSYAFDLQDSLPELIPVLGSQPAGDVKSQTRR